MVPKAVVLFLFALAAVNAEDMKAKLMPVYINHGIKCMKELNAPLSVCKEMMAEGNDNTQAKYEVCKCVPACVAKRVKAITEEGEADEDKITELVAEFQIPEWDEEWKRVKPICKPLVEGKKDCPMASEFIGCAYKESEIFRKILHKYIDAMA